MGTLSYPVPQGRACSSSLREIPPTTLFQPAQNRKSGEDQTPANGRLAPLQHLTQHKASRRCSSTEELKKSQQTLPLPKARHRMYSSLFTACSPGIEVEVSGCLYLSGVLHSNSTGGFLQALPPWRDVLRTWSPRPLPLLLSPPHLGVRTVESSPQVQT